MLKKIISIIVILSLTVGSACSRNHNDSNNHDYGFLRKENRSLKKKVYDYCASVLFVNHLYKNFVQDYILSEHSKKLNNILLDPLSTQEQREQANNEMQRFSTAYANQRVLLGTITSDSKTYNEIGIKDFAHTVPTNLIAGETALIASLCAPTVKNKNIQKNQQIQKFLEENEKLFDEIYGLVHQAKSGESALLDIWNKHKISQENRTMNDYLFPFPIPLLKDSAMAGNFMRTIRPLMIPSLICFSQIISHIEISCLGSSASGVLQCFCDNFNKVLSFFDGQECLEGIQSINTISGKLKFVISLAKIAVPMKILEFQKEEQKSHMFKLALATCGSSFLINIHLLHAKRTSKQEVAIHQSLIDAATYVRSAEQLHKKIEQSPELHEQFPQFCSTYNALRNGEKTRSVMSDLLETKTFTGSPAIFSNVGRIALVLQRISNPLVRDQFIPLINQMGEIDKNLALVKYKKNNAYNAPFIYAEPTLSAKTFIDIEDCVYPAKADGVPNSISVGGDDPQCAVITGPNGCGKSLSSKSFAANYILATTLGFVHAKKFDFSPMYEILYSANIADTSGQISRYQAEAKDLRRLYTKNEIATVRNMPGLYILDEPCSATNAQEGARVVGDYIGLVKNIINSNSLNFIITHHTINVDDGQVKHYHVDHFNIFKLFLGRSYKSNAKQIADEEFEQAKKDVAKFVAQLQEEKNSANKESEPTDCDAE